MRTEYKHNPPIPYSLHDMRVKKIIIQDQTIALEFEDGYEKLPLLRSLYLDGVKKVDHSDPFGVIHCFNRPFYRRKRT